MAVSNKPWGSIKESDYKDAAAFCSACLIDLNEPGGEKSKSKCKLPYKEPGGAINRNGVHAAAQRLNQTRAPSAAKKGAARKLLRLYRQIGDEPPDSLKRMAG